MLSVCKKCNKTWYHDVTTCIYCGNKLKVLESKSLKVIGVTEVFTQSADHMVVPYFDLLLEDEFGHLHIKKSFKKRLIGETLIGTPEETKTICLGVVGTGITGTGIVEVALICGFNVIWLSRSENALSRALGRIEKNLQKSLTEEDKNKVLSHVKCTTNKSHISSADLIIESVVENIDVKKSLFKELDGLCSRATVLATNTSSLSVDELASVTKRPEKVIGMHFFNPVPKMHLVEVVKGERTSTDAIKLATKVAEELNKTVVITNDSPCFIVNRLLMPYLNEAVYLLSQGIATKEDIDTAARLGLNYPMGPLALLDLIGLDVFLSIMGNLYLRTHDKKFKVPVLVENMVKEGKLGRKTGIGFYYYSS